MKYFKLFMLMVMASLFVACSDDDDDFKWNTNSAATVTMGNSELAYKENKGLVNIPIAVSGERNGYVKVTVEVKETSANPAMDDVHYIVTTKTINIPAEATEGYIELKTVDDPDINENRQFTMSIVSAEHATIGSNASTLITLKDNDSEFYEKLQGNWKMTASNSAGANYEWNVQILGYDEGEAGYNEYLYLYGIMGYNWTEAELQFHFDKSTGDGWVAFTFPYNIAEGGVNFSGLGVCDVYIYGVKDGSFTTEPLYGHWNDDFTQLTFDETPYVYARLFQDGAPNGYTWFNLRNIKLTR